VVKKICDAIDNAIEETMLFCLVGCFMIAPLLLVAYCVSFCLLAAKMLGAW
jgi:hypothetical protein